MHTDDPLRDALRRLLRGTDSQPAGTPERRREVAHQAGVNPDTLYQIASGVLLPSGAPRSVGRPLRLKLDAAFPNWLDGIGDSTAPSIASSRRDGPSIRAALSIIRERLISMNPDDSQAVAEALRLLAVVPDSERAFEQAAALLTATKK